MDLYIKKDSSILEIGCGIGDVMEYLNYCGYQNVIGTDISDAMLEICQNKQLNVKTADYILSRGQKCDVVLVSHVIEHMSYEQLRDFLERYLGILQDGGLLLIISPLMSNRFYTDIDHVKPYNIDSVLRYLQTEMTFSKSYRSNYNAELVDIYFRKERFDILNSRIRYKPTFLNRVLYGFSKVTLEIIYRLSFGIVGRTTGYAALLRVNT